MRQTLGLTFSQALVELKMGLPLARQGWNGTNLLIKIQYPDDMSYMTLPYIYMEYPQGHKTYPAGCRVPWLASQTDLLMDDWVIVGQEADDMGVPF